MPPNYELILQIGRYTIVRDLYDKYFYYLDGKDWLAYPAPELVVELSQELLQLRQSVSRLINPAK